jgi:hypothetical protein
VTLFLILLPYGAFATLMLVTSTGSSLFGAAAVCLAIIAFDVVRRRAVKMLGAGSAVIFAALACYQVLSNTPLSGLAVRIAVDSGLLVIGIVSLIIRRPFTLQYAREMATSEAMQRPDFLAVNYVITAVWTLAFLLMISANLLLISLPDLPLWSGLAMAFLIRNPAVYFSKWYPDYQLRKYKTSSVTSTTAPAR